MHLLLFFLVIPLYLVVNLLKTTWHHRSLLSIPGPFTTRVTKLWYFNRVRLGGFERDNIRLHEKYGPVVRIAPDHYSIRDRAAVRIVYGNGSRFAKSAWYEGWKHPDPNRWTLFPDRDIRRHGTPLVSDGRRCYHGGVKMTDMWIGETRKRFASLYSMSSLVHYEAFVDNCADIFAQRLRERDQCGRTLNLGHWFQCYAFDVIGEITFGQRFGWSHLAFLLFFSSCPLLDWRLILANGRWYCWLKAS